jgi:glycerol-3-phosphate O-acyltransferase
VVLMGNHQSEGDAAFIPLLTEVSHPGLGEQVTYVAGDRVVTDLLCKPFSMGKNLLCVHSKKHMAGLYTLNPS